MYYLYQPFKARNIILRNLVFVFHLFICRQKVFSTISQIKIYTILIICLVKFAYKNKNNYNIIIMWSHVILLVIISNNILLSLYSLTTSLPTFQYIKPHSSITDWLFYIALIRNALATIVLAIIQLQFQFLFTNLCLLKFCIKN